MTSRINRRGFLRVGTLAAGSACAPGLSLFAAQERSRLFSSIGMSGPLHRASFLKEQGVEFLTVGTDDLLCPDQTEEKFLPRLEKALASPLPVLACNVFLSPAHLKCVGPDANHDRVLERAAVCFERLKRVKASFMVFGSSGARRVPKGWPRDEAVGQFVDLLKRMAPLAAEQGVTVVVEQLRSQECNFLNRVRDAASIIRAVGHPRVRLLADFYHMASEGDTPEDLRSAMEVIVHTEIAEKAERTYPGTKGDDFRPYFRVLGESGYRGAISIEGSGKESQVAAAIREIARQAANG